MGRQPRSLWSSGEEANRTAPPASPATLPACCHPPQKGEGPIAVIVAPTRELAEQIHKETRERGLLRCAAAAVCRHMHCSCRLFSACCWPPHPSCPLLLVCRPLRQALQPGRVRRLWRAVQAAAVQGPARRLRGTLVLECCCCCCMARLLLSCRCLCALARWTNVPPAPEAAPLTSARWPPSHPPMHRQRCAPLGA